MKEPTPRRTSPPLGKEPTLTVGIILEEDCRTSCTLSPTHVPYVLQSGDFRCEISTQNRVEISLLGDNFSIALEGTTQSIPSSHPLLIFPKDNKKQPLAPQTGLQIEKIVAGRTFHWKKEISQVLPGTFEVHSQQGKLILVNQLGFEDYCACVIASEMSPECPASFAQAQATAARSWSYVFLRNKHPGEKFQICNDDDCQRYQGTTHLSQPAIDAVRGSAGQFLVSEDGVTCPAYYSKSCGGYLEDPWHSFGFTIPPLITHADTPASEKLNLKAENNFKSFLSTPPTNCFCSPQTVPETTLKKYLGAVDELGSYFRWTYRVSREELSTRVREKSGTPNLKEVRDLHYGARGVSGRLTELTVRFEDSSGKEASLKLKSQYDIRRTLHASFLFSSAFIHRWEKGESSGKDTLVIDGAGWGHGVGLCQIGAVGMALKGYTFEQILKHYFPGCVLVTAYE
jgi:stage II sporulation protein D